MISSLHTIIQDCIIDHFVTSMNSLLPANPSLSSLLQIISSFSSSLLSLENYIPTFQAQPMVPFLKNTKLLLDGVLP